MKLSVILAPDIASLVLCALRLDLKDTNGRKVGTHKSSGKWTRTGRLVDDGSAMSDKESLRKRP